MDRITGCIMGGAVADAIGYQVEFTTLQEILRHRRDGVTGPLPNAPLLASDDTQMTLFTMRGLQAAHERLVDYSSEAALLELAEDVRIQLLDWLDTQGLMAFSPHCALDSLARLDILRRRRAPGNTCLDALRRGGNGTPDIPINDSKGCGAVMRSAPIGLLRGIPPSAAYRLGCLTGALTHGHVDGWAPAGAIAAMTVMLASGQSLEQAVTSVIPMMPMDSESRFLMVEVLNLYGADRRLEGLAMTSVLGTGWTGESALALGVHAALAGADYGDAVRIAATHDGDSDSTASIAGQLLGTRDGLDIIPQAWIAGLDLGGLVQAECARFSAGFPAAQEQVQNTGKAPSRLDSILNSLKLMGSPFSGR